jgi:hypothetical protein
MWRLFDSLAGGGAARRRAGRRVLRAVRFVLGWEVDGQDGLPLFVAL